MYGRFGMKSISQAFAIIDKIGLKKFMANYNILDEKYLGNLILISYTSKTINSTTINAEPQILTQLLENLPGNTNVAIASAVTAYSRMIINTYKLEAIKLGAELYYSDTDSMVINRPLPAELVDNAELGKLKLEYKIKEGIFIIPKVYCLELEDGKVITKCKSYSGKLSKEQYLQLLEGHPLDLQVTKWKRSLRDSTIQVKPNSKVLLIS